MFIFNSEVKLKEDQLWSREMPSLYLNLLSSLSGKNCSQYLLVIACTVSVRRVPPVTVIVAAVFELVNSDAL
jgi:hypothetical protein